MLGVEEAVGYVAKGLCLFGVLLLDPTLLPLLRLGKGLLQPIDLLPEIGNQVSPLPTVDEIIPAEFSFSIDRESIRN